MNIEDIEKWDAIRLRFREKPTRDVFMEFANVCSKFFMEDEPEQWYRFCDGNYTQTAFHKEWLDLIVENDRIAIECAREHHKTSFILNYILYQMLHNENFSVIYLSATQGQAKSKLQELDDIYGRNNHWIDIEKDSNNWSKFHKQFENGANITGEGFGTALEGAHVQLIVMDDILQEEGTGGMSDKEIWNYYSKVVSPMVTEGGKIILIGTKKRRGDIFDKIDNNSRWAHERYPSTPENPIFPEKWPIDRLEAKRKEMMPRNFKREFGLEVVIGEDVLIEPDWNEKNRDYELEYPTEGWKEGLNVLGVDPAISPTGDYAAFFSMSLRDTGIRSILDWQRERGMSLNEMIMKMQRLDTKYNYQTIVIEKNSFQRIIVEEAIDQTSLPISGHETTKMKSDPSDGLPRIAVMFENGKYRYPYKTDEDKEHTDEMFDALNSLRYNNGRLENNHTPDIVMAKYMAEQAIKRWESGNNGLGKPLVRGVKGGL